MLSLNTIRSDIWPVSNPIGILETDWDVAHDLMDTIIENIDQNGSTIREVIEIWLNNAEIQNHLENWHDTIQRKVA